MSAVFERIAIIGLGLIGSSIARAAREYHLADIIVGCDANETTLTYARSHQFIDSGVKDPAVAVKSSQLVVLATPPSTLLGIAKKIAPVLEKGTIVMDTASVKQAAVEAIAPQMPVSVDFIPAHPIAGSEQSGASAGRADLFAKKFVIVTPDEPIESDGLKAITRFWKGMGARVEGMPPLVHDVVYAHVSHLPQILAYAAHKALAEHTKDPSLARFLRIAASSPALWTDIFMYNKANLLAALNRYLDAAHHVQGELTKAPEEDTMPNIALAYGELFPRIAASCLVTTVMEAEKKSGFAFARYAGSGFADFTSPAASQSPEDTIAHISDHARAVNHFLGKYITALQHIHDLIEQDRFSELQKHLSQ